jgi:Flp pilus assembly protein TadD
MHCVNISMNLKSFSRNPGKMLKPLLSVARACSVADFPASRQAMDRFFVRTASIVVCAVWAAGCGGPAATDSSLTGPTAKASTAADTPTTLAGEVASAHALRVKGDYPGAAKAFGQLMLAAPDDPAVVAEYGKTLVQQERSKDALAFLQRAEELQANDWTVYSAMGVAYDQLDDHAHARLAYEQALHLKPGAYSVLNNYAVSRMLAGDLEGARRLFAQTSPSSDPKIAANLAVLATMSKRSAVAVASTTLPAAHPAPQHMAAIKPQAGVSHTTGTADASGAPRVLAGVVMEKAPVDPQAGTVGHRKAELAQSDTHSKPGAAAAASKEPVLRTAADGE